MVLLSMLLSGDRSRGRIARLVRLPLIAVCSYVFSFWNMNA